MIGSVSIRIQHPLPTTLRPAGGLVYGSLLEDSSVAGMYSQVYSDRQITSHISSRGEDHFSVDTPA